MNLQDFLNDALPNTGEPITNLLLRIVAALIILVFGRWLSKMLSELLRRALTRAGVDETLAPFLGRVSYYLLLVLVVIIALGVLGVPTTSLIAILGAATLAIGLAVQDSINNLASGIMIILLRPFVIGDYVEMDDEEGFIAEIRIFHTLITTRDNKAIFVPNKDVLGGKITNYTLTDLIRLDLVFGISYGDDILKAKKIVEEILLSDERIAKVPAPTVWVKELGDNSVDLVAWPYVKAADEPQVTFTVTEQVKLRFDAMDITIPFPQRDIHIYQEGLVNSSPEKK